MEINFKDFCFLILSRLPIILLGAIVGAVLFFGYSKFTEVPKYDCEITMIVNADNDSTVTSGTIKASQELIKSYVAIMKDYSFAKTIKENLENPSDYTIGEIRSGIISKAVDNSQILSVTVRTKSPDKSYAIASAIQEIAPTRLRSYFDNTGSIMILRSAVKPKNKNGSNTSIKTLLGAVIGAIIMIGVLLLKENLDTTVRGEEDIISSVQLPILGLIGHIE